MKSKAIIFNELINYTSSIFVLRSTKPKTYPIMNRFLLFFAILIVISFHACDGGGVNDNDAVVCDSAAILADHIETHEDVITDTDTINPLACPGD